MAEVGQHRGDGRRRRRGIDQPARIGIERGRAQAGRQDNAVAIEDIGALGWRLARAARRRMDRAAAMQGSDLDEPPRQHQESQGEDPGNRKQAVAPDLECVFGRLARRRLRPPWLRCEFSAPHHAPPPPLSEAAGSIRRGNASSVPI